jgi:energy-coupling factor transporter transmembrane protein EcfT
MNLLLMIIGAIVAAVAVAFVVVKYLPLKLRWIPSVILLLLAIFLGVKIYDGILEPIKFSEEKVQKFSVVVDNLKIIRDAEVKYYEVNAKYTKDKAGLINFINTAKLAITETKTIVKKVQKSGGVIIDEEIRVTDTIGYEPVLKYFKGRNFTDMFKVPGVDGVEFELEIGSVEKVPGLVVATFRARTPKKGILIGMNESLMKQEMEAIENDQIKGEFVSVGSLDEVTTGGNWPPAYDKKDGAKKD